MKKNRLLIIAILVLVLTLSLIIYLKGSNASKKEYLIESRINNIEDLKKTSESPVLGWLRVQNTNIDYPIIYRRISGVGDNIDFLWSTRFVREEDGENRTVIYGHNIRNVSSKPLYKDNTLVRFEELMYFTYYDFAKDSQFIQVTHDGEDHLYRVYAVYFTDIKTDSGQMMITKEATTNYINKGKEKSIYDFHIDVNENDSIISLITCTRFFENVDDEKYEDLTQFKIDAREVRENEKAINSRVTKTSNYGIIEKIIGGNYE